MDEKKKKSVDDCCMNSSLTNSSVLHVREGVELDTGSGAADSEDTSQPRDVEIRPNSAAEAGDNVSSQQKEIENEEAPRTEHSVLDPKWDLHDPKSAHNGKQRTNTSYPTTAERTTAPRLLQDRHYGVKNTVLVGVYMIAALLSSVHLFWNVFVIMSFDSGGLQNEQHLDKSSKTHASQTPSREVHILSELMKFLISVAVPAYRFLTCGHLCEHKDKHLQNRRGKWCHCSPYSFFSCCKKEKLQLKYTQPQNVQWFPVSKGHVNERCRKGKHQRWKKVNHIGEQLEIFPFLSMHAAFLGTHHRFAVVYPVNQQKSGQNRKPSGDSDGEVQHCPQESANGRWPPETVNGVPWSAFREELRRLGTFAEMPVNMPVFVIPLARTGFLRLPDGNIVCYYCGVRHNTWQAGDVPSDVHRRLNPQCPMVTGMNCDNQGVSRPPEEREEELLRTWSLQGGVARQPAFISEVPDMQSQGQGQASGGASASVQHSGDTTAGYRSLPSEQLSADHAHSGQQSGSQQTGQSAGAGAGASVGASNITGGRITDGTAQPVVPPPSLGQETRDPTRSGQGQQVVTYEQLGITTEAPKRPDMSMLNARVASYRNWPPGNSHTPLQLAEAGFYYAGYADCGRCFFCGGGLKNWERNDNPWVEHARWFARCPYVRQCQGQDFIDIVQDLNATHQQISMADVQSEINRRRADGEHLQEPVVDPAISSALENGYTQEQVDHAVEQIRQEGYPLTAAKLMDYLQEEGAVGGQGIADDDFDYEPGSVDRLTEENSEIRQQRMCKICLDKEVCIVFLPCGHLVCCAECSPAIRQCPMCRQRVKGRVRAFPS